MNKYFKQFEIFVIVVIISLIGIVYAFKQKLVLVTTTDQVTNTPLSTRQDISTTETPAPAEAATNVPITTIEYRGLDDQNALDLLKASHQVMATHYSFGDLVTSIDGITPDKSHFWAFYVNGKFSQVGASSFQTKSSDMIKWQVEEVDNTK